MTYMCVYIFVPNVRRHSATAWWFGGNWQTLHEYAHRAHCLTVSLVCLYDTIKHSTHILNGSSGGAHIHRINSTKAHSERSAPKLCQAHTRLPRLQLRIALQIITYEHLLRYINMCEMLPQWLCTHMLTACREVAEVPLQSWLLTHSGTNGNKQAFFARRSLRRVHFITDLLFPVPYSIGRAVWMIRLEFGQIKKKNK